MILDSFQVIEKMERETGFEPATSSLGSWHSTTELLPRPYDLAIELIPNHLAETAAVSKVSQIHQISLVWMKNGHQNGHHGEPENVPAGRSRLVSNLVSTLHLNRLTHTIP